MSEVGAKFVSSKNLVWELYRDLGSQEELNYSDIYEWLIDFLAFVGHPNNYVHKVTGHKDNPHLDIKNYRAKLPCDFAKIRQVAVNGFPAYPSTNNFHQLMDGSCCGTDELGTFLTDGTFTDNFGNVFITNLGTNYSSTPLSYELNNDYITLSVKEGKVCMSYMAYAVDKDGLPMIPDNISYKEGAKKFITNKIDYIRWRNNPDSPGLKALYEDSSREYEWYLSQSQNQAKMPDVNTMEVIKNSLLRLAPSPNMWETFFSGLPNPEIRKIR